MSDSVTYERDAAETPDLQSLIDKLNREQNWLSVTPFSTSQGMTLEIAIHGHFAAEADSRNPEDVAKSLSAFFASMAANVDKAIGEEARSCSREKDRGVRGSPMK